MVNDKINTLLENNPHLQISKLIKINSSTSCNRLLLLYMYHLFVNKKENTLIVEAFNYGKCILNKCYEELLPTLQSLKRKDSHLITKGVITCKEENDVTYLKLTSKAKIHFLNFFWKENAIKEAKLKKLIESFK